MNEEPNEDEVPPYDAGYAAGSLSVWTQQLMTARQAVVAITGDDTMDRDRLLILHAETVDALREICDEFGDNDWPDDLHPADVIERHLARHLRKT